MTLADPIHERCGYPASRHGTINKGALLVCPSGRPDPVLRNQAGEVIGPNDEVPGPATASHDAAEKEAEKIVIQGLGYGSHPRLVEAIAASLRSRDEATMDLRASVGNSFERIDALKAIVRARDQEIERLTKLRGLDYLLADEAGGLLRRVQDSYIGEDHPFPALDRDIAAFLDRIDKEKP
jgi:hypothetical protein